MRKLGKDNLIDTVAVIIAFLMMTAIVLYSSITRYLLKSEFFLLEDHVTEIEDYLGEYSDYYVIATAPINGLPHGISGTEIRENEITIMLPSYMGDDIIVDFYTGWDEKIGSYRCNFKKNPVYSVKGKTIQIVKSDLPFVFVDVDKDNFSEVNKSHTPENPEKIKSEGFITAYVDGKYLNEATMTIGPRGSATWNLYLKRPYSIKMDNDTMIFGFGNIKKYNLMANASDKTLLKNEVFFDLCNSLDLQYTPKIRNVNMFINNQYKGIYSVSTKVKQGKNTLPLDKNDFLVCFGAPNYKNIIPYESTFWTEESEDSRTPRSYVDLEWPETNDERTINKVQSIIQNYIDIIEGKKEGKLSDYIDLDSFAKYYWVQEIGKNADGMFRSTYMYYKAKDGKLYMGPMWDMEFVLGSVLVKDGASFIEPEGWAVRECAYYKYLFKNKEFVDAVNRIYYEYDIESKMQESYENYQNKINKLSLEGEINYEMWKDEQNFYDIVVTEDNPTYQDFCNRKLEFYKTRIDWITNEMRKSKNN